MAFQAIIMSSSSKKSRIDSWLNKGQKEFLEASASNKNLSFSPDLPSNCLSEEQTGIAHHQKLVLSDLDRDLFLSLIENPPQPNQNLVSAMQNFQKEYADCN